MSKIYRKRKLPSYEVIIKQTPFFFMDENGEEHFDSDDEVVQELVRCRDCKYRPHLKEDASEEEKESFKNGYYDGCDLRFPIDWKCPCQVADEYYSWYPKDDWFCADGEVKKDEE